MPQTTKGLYGILNSPVLYKLSQSLVGGHKSFMRLVRTDIQPFPGMRLLDMGCGPGALLGYLPDDVDYVGFDISQSYIDRAKAIYGSKGTFYCSGIDGPFLGNFLSSFDIAVAYCILHHLNNQEAQHLFSLAWNMLLPGGRLIVIDPCFLDGQSPLARLIIRWDRGQKVRRPSEYVALAKMSFATVQSRVESDRLRIPYTHHLMICVRE